jgi:hypothetical protein
MASRLAVVSRDLWSAREAVKMKSEHRSRSISIVRSRCQGTVDEDSVSWKKA